MNIIKQIKERLCKTELKEIEREREVYRARIEYIRFLLEQILEVLSDDY